MDALVSIIVPAYNAEQYMENCFRRLKDRCTARRLSAQILEAFMN